MRDSPLDKPVTITAYQDGPYLIRGPFRLTDQDGGEIGLERRTIALCRCGRSRIRPFCDGTHRSIGFRAPSGPEERLLRSGDDAALPTGRDGAARVQAGTHGDMLYRAVAGTPRSRSSVDAVGVLANGREAERSPTRRARRIIARMPIDLHRRLEQVRSLLIDARKALGR